MKTKLKIAALAFVGGVFSMNGQIDANKNFSIEYNKKLYSKSTDAFKFEMIPFTTAGNTEFRNFYPSGTYQFYVSNGANGSANTLGLFINQFGNVGIGDQYPGGKFSIRDANQVLNFLTNKKLVGTWPATSEARTMTIQSSGSSAGNLAFATGNTEVMRLTEEANIGIGTTTPAAKLDVNGSVVIKDGHNISWGNKYGAGIPTIASNITSGMHFYPAGATSGATFRIFKDGGAKFTNNLEVVGDLKIPHDKTLGAGSGTAVKMWGIRGQAGSNQRLELYDRVSIGYPDGWNSFPEPPQHGLYVHGAVNIGSKSTGKHKLAVEGSIGAREIKVQAFPGWADFVFEKEYQLPSLTEVADHIKRKGHLKDIPSAKEVAENGFYLGAMDAKLLQKIEELTLYTIQQEKEIQTLKKQQEKIDAQEQKIQKLEALVQKLLATKK